MSSVKNLNILTGCEVAINLDLYSCAAKFSHVRFFTRFCKDGIFCMFLTYSMSNSIVLVNLHAFFLRFTFAVLNHNQKQTQNKNQ